MLLAYNKHSVNGTIYRMFLQPKISSFFLILNKKNILQKVTNDILGKISLTKQGFKIVFCFFIERVL